LKLWGPKKLFLFFLTVLFITFLNKGVVRKPERAGFPAEASEAMPTRPTGGNRQGGQPFQALLLKPSLIYKEDGY
jgi:hypothetical protein